MREKEKQITPPAKIVYSVLTRPDTRFDSGGEYIATVRVDESNRAAITGLVNEAVRFGAKQLNIPEQDVRVPFNSAKGELKAKMKASYRDKTGVTRYLSPDLVDAAAEPWPEGSVIWTGSSVRLSYVVDPVKTPNYTGVAFRLQGVQVVDLAPSPKKGRGGFESMVNIVATGSDDGPAEEALF